MVERMNDRIMRLIDTTQLELPGVYSFLELCGAVNLHFWIPSRVSVVFCRIQGIPRKQPVTCDLSSLIASSGTGRSIFPFVNAEMLQSLEWHEWLHSGYTLLSFFTSFHPSLSFPFIFIFHRVLCLHSILLFRSSFDCPRSIYFKIVFRNKLYRGRWNRKRKPRCSCLDVWIIHSLGQPVVRWRG